MDIAAFIDSIGKLSQVSIYAVLLVIIGSLGWLVWKLIDRITDNTEIHRSGVAVNDEISKRIATAFEKHNEELQRNNHTVNQIMDFCNSQTDWIKGLLNDRLSQEQAFNRLETASHNTAEKLDEVISAVNAISRSPRDVCTGFVPRDTHDRRKS